MRAHAGPRMRRAVRFDPWAPAFLLALGVFAASLLVGTIVVLRSMRAAAGGPIPATTPQAGEIAPAQVAATVSNATADPPPTLAPVLVAQTPGPELHGDVELGAAIVDALGPDLDHYGVVVKRLSDGRGATVNADKQFYAASLFKLAVLEEAERRVSAGTLKLDDRLTLTDEDVAEDLGTLSEAPLAEDGSISIREALRAMVTLSDNSTAVALLHLLGAGEIDRTLRSLGVETMSVNTTDLPTTAADMARLMETVVTGRGLTAAAQGDARTLLLAQETRGGIPQGVPDGVSVGNKTGTWDATLHDVAFVEAPGGTYVIAVLTDGSGGWAPITRVSGAVYAVLARQ